jgi:hypothetical protein
MVGTIITGGVVPFTQSTGSGSGVARTGGGYLSVCGIILNSWWPSDQNKSASVGRIFSGLFMSAISRFCSGSCYCPIALFRAQTITAAFAMLLVLVEDFAKTPVVPPTGRALAYVIEHNKRRYRN